MKYDALYIYVIHCIWYGMNNELVGWLFISMKY